MNARGPAAADSINGGTLVVRTLKKAGVKALFALHGAHIDAIFQAAIDEGMRLIDVRHEAAAGHAAEGYARSLRSLGVAVVTSGAGFTNAVSSMANARVDRTPVLYISGAPSLGDAETNTLQDGIDHVAIAKPLVKWSQQINRAQDIPRLIALAIRIATTPPMGPVFVNLPMDVGLSVISAQTVPIPDNLITASPCHPAPGLVERAVRLLRDAQRPIVLAGSDAWYADAGRALVRFTDASGIPVFTDFAAHGLLPASHPLYGGTTHKLVYVGDQKPDVVLALGTRFGLFTLGGGDRLFSPDACFIHVDADAAEFGRLRTADVGIVADPVAMLEALAGTWQGAARVRLQRWGETVRTARDARRAHFEQSAARTASPIHPWSAVSTIAAAAREDILVADGAEAYHWLNEAVAQEHPGSYLTHGFLGCMGIGLGLAIGAQVANPERRVLLMVGDGAVGFNIAEFDTLVRQRLPIVVVVMNNHSWGASQRFQQVFPAARHVTGTVLGEAQYHRVAAGFGCAGVYVDHWDALGPAIEAAFASGIPTCIDARIDFEPMPPELGLMMGEKP